jgi:glycosyltransferase involved in cell wall biosynthesis
MRILLIAEDFVLNGVTRHIIDLANGLAEAGHTVFVAATPSTQKERLNPAVTFVPLSLCYPESYNKKWSGIFKSMKILLKTIGENHIEIVHTHKRYVDLLGRIAALLTGVKHISTCHNEFSNYRWLSPFGDIIIAPCSEIAQMLMHDFGFHRERVKIVLHGIKPFNSFSAEVNKQQRQSLGIKEDIKVILSVGHLNRQKDRPTLIEALRILQEQGRLEKVLCMIVGEGEESSTVQAMIHTYNLEEKIKLLPALSNIEALNNVADFCVLSSIHEALPYVVLEAASIGKPHISTIVGFIPSFIGNNEAGICVPPSNPRQLAEGIQYLLLNPSRVTELGKAAQEKFNQYYTYESFINNTLSIYEKALSMKK